MKRAILIATLVLASVSLSKPANAMTWNEIGQLHELEQVLYLTGVHKGYQTALAMFEKFSIPTIICVPKGVSANQMGMVAIKYFKNNPEIWNEEVSVKALLHWMDTWPCK